MGLRNLHLLLFVFCVTLPMRAGAQEAIPGEFIVKLKGSYTPSKSGQFFGKVSGKARLKASYGELNMHHMSMKAGQDVNTAMNEMRNDPDVEYVEPNYILRRFEDIAGLDSRVYSDEDVHGLSATEAYSQSYAPVNQVQAWGSMKAGADSIPLVAVVDTGVDYTHSVFTSSNAIWTNPGEVPGNGMDDDGNGYVDDVRGWNFFANNADPMDDEGHGTHVAGIVLGVTQDIFYSTAQTAKIRILPLKFMGSDGSGATSGAVNSIYYAVNQGARVINCSWGGGSYSQALHDAMAYAYARSVVLVTASGNYAKNNDVQPMYPANYPVPSQISIAASTDYDYLATFSNYGNGSVHVSAPGVGILSTYPGQTYRFMSGTSMAAPFVAGLAALVLREAPQLTGYQIKNILMNSVEHLSALYGKVSSQGRVDSYSTVVNAKAQAGAAPYQPAYAASGGSRGPSSSQKMAGCGLVGSALSQLRGAGPSSPTGISLIVAFSLVPLIAWSVMRSRKPRRKHERFVMHSDIRVKMGDRELVGHMNTISLGGLSFNADSMLEKGGVVNIQISSPDGKEQVQVEGRIVWSEANKAYGVQFAEVKTGVLSSLRTWTAGLSKAS